MKYQTPLEFDRLLQRYRDQPQRQFVLEIGSMTGETLRPWMTYGDRPMTMVSIDKVVPPSDSRHIEQMEAHTIHWPHYAEFHGVDLLVIDGYSQAPETIAAVRAKVPYLDFLFIDGGHDYATVRSDFENYEPLVKPGGLIAFHDIQGIPDVARYWAEVKGGRSWYEYCEPGGWGIGCFQKALDRPVLHVLTACSRPANLPLLEASLLPALPLFDIRWWIVADGTVEAPPNAAAFDSRLNVKTSALGPNTYNVGGKAALNFALDQIGDGACGAVWGLDDDNIAAPGFFECLYREVMRGYPMAVAFAQRHLGGGVRPVGPDRMKECSIDQAQYVACRELIGADRFELLYTADGKMAQRLYEKNPTAWRFNQSPVTYYNWLRPT